MQYVYRVYSVNCLDRGGVVEREERVAFGEASFFLRLKDITTFNPFAEMLFNDFNKRVCLLIDVILKAIRFARPEIFSGEVSIIMGIVE